MNNGSTFLVCRGTAWQDERTGRTGKTDLIPNTMELVSQKSADFCDSTGGDSTSQKRGRDPSTIRYGAYDEELVLSPECPRGKMITSVAEQEDLHLHQGGGGRGRTECVGGKDEDGRVGDKDENGVGGKDEDEPPLITRKRQLTTTTQTPVDVLPPSEQEETSDRDVFDIRPPRGAPKMNISSRRGSGAPHDPSSSSSDETTQKTKQPQLLRVNSVAATTTTVSPTETVGAYSSTSSPLDTSSSGNHARERRPSTGGESSGGASGSSSDRSVADAPPMPALNDSARKHVDRAARNASSDDRSDRSVADAPMPRRNRSRSRSGSEGAPERAFCQGTFGKVPRESSPALLAPAMSEDDDGDGHGRNVYGNMHGTMNFRAGGKFGDDVFLDAAGGDLALVPVSTSSSSSGRRELSGSSTGGEGLQAGGFFHQTLRNGGSFAQSLVEESLGRDLKLSPTLFEDDDRCCYGVIDEQPSRRSTPLVCPIPQHSFGEGEPPEFATTLFHSLQSTNKVKWGATGQHFTRPPPLGTSGGGTSLVPTPPETGESFVSSTISGWGGGFYKNPDIVEEARREREREEERRKEEEHKKELLQTAKRERGFKSPQMLRGMLFKMKNHPAATKWSFSLPGLKNPSGAGLKALCDKERSEKMVGECAKNAGLPSGTGVEEDEGGPRRVGTMGRASFRSSTITHAGLPMLDEEVDHGAVVGEQLAAIAPVSKRTGCAATTSFDTSSSSRRSSFDSTFQPGRLERRIERAAQPVGAVPPIEFCGPPANPLAASFGGDGHGGRVGKVGPTTLARTIRGQRPVQWSPRVSCIPFSGRRRRDKLAGTGGGEKSMTMMSSTPVRKDPLQNSFFRKKRRAFAAEECYHV